MSRLRWKMNPPARGLARVAAGPRGHTLTDGTTRFATVYPFSSGFHRYEGWYWVAGWESSVPHMNTCGTPVSTVAEAKAAALEYVKQHIKAANGELK